jgi:hypothetical protein
MSSGLDAEANLELAEEKGEATTKPKTKYRGSSLRSFLISPAFVSLP